MSTPHDNEHLHLIQEADQQEEENLLIAAVLLGTVAGFLMGASMISLIWWLW